MANTKMEYVASRLSESDLTSDLTGGIIEPPSGDGWKLVTVSDGIAYWGREVETRAEKGWTACSERSSNGRGCLFYEGHDGLHSFE